MFRFLNNNFSRNAQRKDKANELMNEVANELGVNESARSINENPKQFAERMKQAIQKRT